MRSIYPKIDHKLHGLHALKKYIEKYKGLEVVFTELDENYNFSFEDDIRTICDILPNLKEITIHPPHNLYDLEWIALKDKNIVLDQLERVCSLSLELRIKINIIYHVEWTFEKYQKAMMPLLREMVNKVKGHNTLILLENMYANLETTCGVIHICKFIGDPQLKVCLDLCHISCLAHIYNVDTGLFIKTYLDPKECSKYVHQVHFAEASDGDGYMEYDKTHSKKHQTRGNLIKDVELLYAYGLYDSIFVTDIREDNSNNRRDEIHEIDSLEDIYKMMK